MSWGMQTKGGELGISLVLIHFPRMEGCNITHGEATSATSFLFSLRKAAVVSPPKWMSHFYIFSGGSTSRPIRGPFFHPLLKNKI